MHCFALERRSRLYKQFGNSVTVNVIEAIAKEIRKVLEKADGTFI